MNLDFFQFLLGFQLGVVKKLGLRLGECDFQFLLGFQDAAFDSYRKAVLDLSIPSRIPELSIERTDMERHIIAFNSFSDSSK